MTNIRVRTSKISRGTRNGKPRTKSKGWRENLESS